MDSSPTKKASVLADATFRRFVLIDSLDTVAIGMVTAVLPLLMSEKFGSGNKLIVTMGLLILPRVFLAPVIGHILLKKGPAFTVGLVMAGLECLFLSATHCALQAISRGYCAKKHSWYGRRSLLPHLTSRSYTQRAKDCC